MMEIVLIERMIVNAYPYNWTEAVLNNFANKVFLKRKINKMDKALRSFNSLSHKVKGEVSTVGFQLITAEMQLIGNNKL